MKHQVLMLLPRTTFELVTTKAASELPLKEVLLAKETLGYPRLYFEALRDEGRLISKITKSSQATLAEIIAESASPGVGAILGFPFCAIATNLFKLRYLEKGHSLSRLGDNLLMAPSSRPSAWKTALIMTLRASWHLLLEDKALRESIITELLNDCEYIATLKRIGGLYKI